MKDENKTQQPICRLSQFQAKVVAAGLSVTAAAAILAFVGFIGYVLIKILGFISPAITPVILALFLSMLLRPYYQLIRTYICSNKSMALCIMFASILVPLCLTIWYCGGLLMEQVSNFMANAPDLVEKVSRWVQSSLPRLKSFLSQIGVDTETMRFFNDPRGFAASLLSSAGGTYGANAVSYSMGLVENMFGLLRWLLVLVFLCYFLAVSVNFSGRDVVKQMPFLKTDTKNFVSSQIDLFVNIVVGFFRRQVIICILEGLLYGTGFMIVGLPYGFIIGFLLGVINLIPFLGSILCMAIAIPLAYFGPDGGTLRLSLVVSVWLAGLLADGYLITPLIQGKRTGLSYAGVIFSFMFWGIVFHSFLGLLLAIPLSAFVIVFWQAVKEKYIKGVI